MNLRKLILYFFISTCSGFNLNRRALVTSSISAFKLLSLDDHDNEDENKMINYLQESSNEIYFYGAVTPESCFALRNKINDLTQKSKRFSINYNTEPFPIYLHIQSGGGNLFPVLYVIDIIKNHDNSIPIYTMVDGFAASAATLISVVGQKRYMTKNSLMLIHQLSSGTEEGKYSEIKDQVHNMDSLMKIIIKIYQENTKMDDDTLFDLLQKDIWLNSTECLKYGLVDEII